MSDESKRPALWTRREAILRTAAALGGAALVGQAMMLSGTRRASAAEPATQDGLFSDADIEFLTEMAETLLPETDTPGAKAAGVGPFIALMVTDCYSPAEQAVFLDGLTTIERECRETHGSNFLGLSPGQRLAVAERLDREQFDAMRAGGREHPHYFRMLKELAVLGFFTSETGYTRVLDYAETPGRYEPCRDLDPEVRVQASHAAGLSSS